ncbi:hypothetical protein LWI28_002657 [Acer negundo]|uniref:HMA domain-containing protein n=1 Tax=Acer negundo TaxID=4023 RepID=A0AAD5J7D4_ACENE|nr:hypothetical protein LWI28_002657 [Acer negundo]
MIRSVLVAAPAQAESQGTAQKIVVMLKPKCDKCRSKAMKIASVADGVISVAWEGEEKNKVVMIGDGTDSATVTRRLRKKLGYADLASVEQVK